MPGTIPYRVSKSWDKEHEALQAIFNNPTYTREQSKLVDSIFALEQHDYRLIEGK